MRHLNFRLHYWPILTTVWVIITYITSYALAVTKKDVSAMFPYISDTGAKPVESCIFGQMLNMGAMFMFICMFIRHKYIEMIFKNEKNYSPKILLINKWSFLFGLLGCFGMTIVANFQETANLTTHFFGASLTFLIGSVHFILQTFISWKTNISTFTKYMRLFISSIVLPLFITTLTSANLSMRKFHGKDKLTWGKNDGGYELHLVSTFTEWIMAISLNLYVLTYTNEFKNVKYDGVGFSARTRKRSINI
ncbi:unnamed protein product [Brassicogethes aeneus]|uniref:CWH43-like N-terminal domain-containing protein n=1 Tax=Brassicogethes aeneus TaxID=1431903 RepID=A0A9P0FEM0_BRAAE|nr:unnamed protein product [Brassicogethes aeneus]